MRESQLNKRYNSLDVTLWRSLPKIFCFELFADLKITINRELKNAGVNNSVIEFTSYRSYQIFVNRCKISAFAEKTVHVYKSHENMTIVI